MWLATGRFSCGAFCDGRRADARVGSPPPVLLRSVVHVGETAHGAYHFGCSGRWWGRGGKCDVGSAYWDDYRSSAKGRYVLSAGTLVAGPSPRRIACDVAACTPGHSTKRAVLRNGACYGPSV